MKKFTSVSVVALLSSASMAMAQDTAAQPVVTDEIVVRGVNIPDEKRATSEISAVLDEAAFERQGDNNIADALRRVTGLSLSDGKFVIVRGLNERYSSATLNGNPLPSPEPLRRVAPLDLFPTSVLSGSLVQKTYSPQFSAEFGGGAIDLRIRSLPEEAFFEVSGGVSLDTFTTARDGLTYDGGDLDWLGFDDGARGVPSGIDPFFENGPQVTQSRFTESEQNAIDATVDFADNFILFEGATPPNYNVRVSGGNRFDLNNDVSIGVVANLGFRTEFVSQDGERRRTTGVDNNGTPNDTSDDTFIATSGNELDIRASQQNVGLNGLLSIGAELYDNHEVTLTGLVLRSSTKEARIEEGFNIERDGIRSEFAEFFERQVWQGQLNGEHLFPALADLSATWRFAYGEATRDAPFNTETDFQVDENGIATLANGFVSGFDTPNFTYQLLDDENLSGGIDLTLPLTVSDNAVDVNFGYSYSDKERSTDDRQYRVVFNTGIPEIESSRIDILNEILPTNLARIEQITAGLGNPDNFTGELRVHGAYGQIDAELGPYFRVAAGVRYEDGLQETRSSSSIITNSTAIFDPIDEDYFLPSATLTWNPTGNIQLRAGFSQTIVRPQFREIGPVGFRDPDTDITAFGNPFLQNSEIDNFDARLEWYFARGEFLTIGGFYKDIQNPIEQITGSALAPGDAGASTFVNSPEAELYGVEFEFQKNFAIDQKWTDGWLGRWAQGKELVFITNYTYSQSDVTAGSFNITQFDATGQPTNPIPVTIDGDRSLQGQSDHLANVQLGYENFDENSRATLLLNYASERIRQVGGGAPNNRVVENPPITLDFVYSRTLDIAGGEYEMRARIGNIFGDDYDASQVVGSDEIVFDRYSIGRTFGINLTRRF